MSSRRRFLKQGGLVLASAAIAGSLPRSETVAPRPAANEVGLGFELIRPEDQLAFRVHRSFGFETVPKGGGYVLRATTDSASIEIQLPPQHVLEWFVNGRPNLPVHTAWTLLRFHIPAGTEIPLSTAGFLAAMRDMELLTHSLAGAVDLVEAPSGQAVHVPTADLLRADDAYLVDGQRRGAAQSTEAAALIPVDPQAKAAADAFPPSEPSTRLAVSSRLIISPPGGQTRFTHAAEPVRHGKPWAEVWHTRLTVKTADGGRVEMPLLTRAIAIQRTTAVAGDMDAAKLSALTVSEAEDIVDQDNNTDDESAIRMAKLHLSPRLGASTRLNGKWGGSADVRSFAHTVSTGRDVFFRIAVTGRLFPLGHPAVRTTTIERRFDPGGLSGKPAVLRKQTRIAVKKEHMKYGSRTWPFQSVDILDDTTPTGDSVTVVGGSDYVVDYLRVDGEPYRYTCVGIDHAGKPVEFTMPLIFVPDSGVPTSVLPTIASKYANNSNLSKVPVGRVNVAPPVPGSAKGATEVIGEAKLTGTISSTAFVPTVTEYAGRLPVLADLTDQAQSMVIRYADTFATHGFDTTLNPGEVVFALSGALPVRVMDAAAAGGLFNELDLSILGTSRKFGPVAGSPQDIVGSLGAIAAGTFDPETFLGNTVLNELKLFGIFPLRKLISTAATTLDRAPKITAAAVDGLRTRTFEWQVPLFEDKPPVVVGGAKLDKRPGGNAHLRIESVVTMGLDGQPHRRTACRITDVVATFRLGNADLVHLPVHSIEFVSVGTEKPVVNVHIGEIEFLGVLGFVNRLASLIGGNGFGGARALSGPNAANPANAVVPNGPALDVTTSGVRASYGLAIPSVAVGMFSLENISFGALLNLPFAGSPGFDFNFATPDNPFRLTVSALGGGGYLGLGMSLDKGLERLEGALEFGAQIRIDLKVIKGKVSAMGGIYFKIENGKTTLTGYLTVHGEVSVLSIITLGVMATLSLTYYGGKVRGEAELCFYVSTFFFSKTVKRTFSRTFAGSNGDPTFAELMAPQGFPGARPWDTYCKAFV